MFIHPMEVPLSATALTNDERCGGVCPSYFGHRRQHQVPWNWPSPILRFLDHGGPGRPTKAPSAHRGAPRGSRPTA